MTEDEMNILEVFTELADKVREHLGVKVRYSVQIQNFKTGEWRDLNQTWENAKKAPHSVTRTLADAKYWMRRYNDSRMRAGVPMADLRIVRQVTQFDVVA